MEKIFKVVIRKYCGICEQSIDDGGLCSYGCIEDGSLSRPKGRVIKRTLEITEKILLEEII